MEANDVSGVGNTEKEEVVGDDDFDEDEDTETELVTEERTEEAVADVDKLIDTDELPVVGVGVVEVLQNIIVSQGEDKIQWEGESKPTNTADSEHRMSYSPRTSSRMVLVGIVDQHADDRTDEDEDNNDEGDDNRSPVLAPHGGLLAGVHDGRAAGVADVIRLHDSTRRRRCVVAFKLVQVGNWLRLCHHCQFGKRIRYRLGVLRLAKAAHRRTSVRANTTAAGRALVRSVGAGIAIGGLTCGALIRHLKKVMIVYGWQRRQGNERFVRAV